MITPKLTAVLVAMTALVGYAPVAALAQDSNQENVAGVNVETGGNVQASSQEQTQVADNDVTISNEAESGDAEGGDAEAEAEAESGDAKGKKSKSSAEASAVAIGGDAESGDAVAVQTLENVDIDNDVEQNAVQVNDQELNDQDEVIVDIDQNNENNEDGLIDLPDLDADIIACLLLPPGQIRGCIEDIGNTPEVA